MTGPKAVKVYAGTPQEGWVGVYPVGKGRPQCFVRDQAGKRIVFADKQQAESEALAAFRDFLLTNPDTRDTTI